MTKGPIPHVDLMVLTRDRGALPRRVLDGIRSQRGVRLSPYQIVGHRRDGDANRYETIARARNRAAAAGQSPWVLFLDDDVVLGPECVATLVGELTGLPDWGALAADYLGDRKECPTAVHHVGMGATLFRRQALDRISFRWENKKCECLCCCEDLTRQGIRIGYSRAARAWHLRRNKNSRHVRHSAMSDQEEETTQPQILTALDSHHFSPFRQFFLRSLKATGNDIPVHVVAYGLSRQELNVLQQHPNVQRVIPFRRNSISPAVRRIKGFQVAISDLPDDSLAAWFDAGDIFFQTRLKKLWKIASQKPTLLHAVAEPASHPRNTAVRNWTSRIGRIDVRSKVFDLLAKNVFLNSGVVASSVGSLKDYLPYAEQFLDAADLWEEQPMDQLAFNYYCHSNPMAWSQLDENWNYCLAYRGPGRIMSRTPDDDDYHPDLAMLPRFVDTQSRTIPVVHGNAGMLSRTVKRWFVHQG